MENLDSAVRYTRNQGGASGLGGAVIRDVVTLSTNWGITEKWRFVARGDWVQRTSILDETTSISLEGTTAIVVDATGGDRASGEN